MPVEIKITSSFDGVGHVEKPTTFDHPMGNFQIFRMKDSIAKIVSHDVNSFRNKNKPIPIAKYVDSVNGLDTNSGDDWSNAYKTLTKLKSSAFDKAYLASGNYTDLINNNFSTDREYISVGMSNMAYGYLGSSRTWTNSGGGVWTNPITADAISCIDSDRFDSYGNPFSLLRANSLIDCQNTPDSYFKDSVTGLMNIHTNDGSSPARTSIIFSVSQMVVHAGTNYCENIRFIGGVAISISNATKSVFTAEKCHFSFNSTGNGIKAEGNINLFISECRSYDNFFDGFNYHERYGFNPYFVESNCIGYENGKNNSSSINNGSTAHESVIGLRVGCLYFNNEGPNVHDVNNAKTWNVDCVSFNSVSINPDRRSDFALSAINGELCKMWLDGCGTKDDGSFGAENRSSSAELFQRNSTIKNIKTGTSIIDY